MSLFGFLLLLATGITAIFWYNDWKYQLPTPLPEGYKPISIGQNIDIGQPFSGNKQKPLFLHFFNPNCPCSRFNLPHVKRLIREYSSKVDFAIVVISKEEFTAKEIRNRLGDDVPVFFNEEIATSCGVYSTPQAVIIGRDNKLIYRGNYNRSRYCTDKKTEYARMALDSLVLTNHQVIFDQHALKAYGCALPYCSNK